MFVWLSLSGLETNTKKTGAFIIVLAGILMFLRMKKIDAFSKFRGRKMRKGGNRGLYGWRREDQDQYPTDAPPKYPGETETYGYPSEEKSIPAQQQMDGFFAPVAMPPLAKPEIYPPGSI